MNRTKVLIVDDSALMRQVLSEIIAQDSSLEVVGTALDPYVAWRKIDRLNPDLLTLDVEMPRMDGLTFLEKLMRARPMPVVMISSLTERGCDLTLRALELGAVDFLTKPKLDLQQETMALAGEILAKIKAAAQARVRRFRPVAASPLEPAAVVEPRGLIKGSYDVIAIGASTGGTEALKDFLTPLPSDSPGIVIVQHMPEKFTTQFAARLNAICQIQIKEAADGDRILAGQALLAPGNYHMEVVRDGAHSKVRIVMSEPVNRHRPSVDVLFHSCARQLGPHAVGVILTGMGHDGARGMLAMRQAGAKTFAQDEASCIVFGMPKEAIALGGVEQILPLQSLPGAVLRLVSN